MANSQQEVFTFEKSDQSSSKHELAFCDRIRSLQATIVELKETNKNKLKCALWSLLAILYHAYFITALALNFQRAVPLLVLTIIAWVLILYYGVLKPKYGSRMHKSITRAFEPCSERLENFFKKWKFRLSIYLFLFALVIVFLVVDAREKPRRFMSFAGLVGFLIILFVFSQNRARINWRIAAWGLGLQFGFGLLVLRWHVGFIAFSWVASQITAFLDYAIYGTMFVYGFLASPPNICGMAPVMAFSSLQTIVFFNAVVAILFYYGIIQVIIKKLGWLMQLSMGTTPAESMNAVCDVFLGMSEGPLMIAPYLPVLTLSEINAIITSGLSCIAGSLFAVYASFGACPVHLLSHSIMAAPASLAVAKILLPETEQTRKPVDEDPNSEHQPKKEHNVLEAISSAAGLGCMIVLNIVANLIAFLALLQFANNVLAWLGSMVGLHEFTFELVLSYLFLPLAYIMGCDGTVDDVMVVSRLMGIKTFLNEFIAFQRMGEYIKQGLISPRNQLIATYALCGFSNIGSIGVVLGGLGSLCPERKADMAKVSLLSLLGGSIACFMTACVAGILLDERGPCISSAFFEASRNCTVIP